MLARDDLNQFFAILLDRKLPDGDAGKIISQVRSRTPHSAIVIVTGHADMDSTLAAWGPMGSVFCKRSPGRYSPCGPMYW